MKDNLIETYSEEETMLFAEKLAEQLNPGDVVALEGDLGTGKTAFTKGLAAGLGVTRVVNSPTFTIVKEYQGNYPLYHMDVYRLEDSDEDIGFDEYFQGDGICIVEWPEFIPDYLPASYLRVSFTYINEHTRSMKLIPYGARYESVVTAVIDR